MLSTIRLPGDGMDRADILGQSLMFSFFPSQELARMLS